MLEDITLCGIDKGTPDRGPSPVTVADSIMISFSMLLIRLSSWLEGGNSPVTECSAVLKMASFALFFSVPLLFPFSSSFVYLELSDGPVLDSFLLFFTLITWCLFPFAEVLAISSIRFLTCIAFCLSLLPCKLWYC
jgi:hypothetical protein